VETLLIDPMTPEDWPAVRAIYEEGIATGVGTFETAAPSWDQWNAARLPHSRLVARAPATLGWAALSRVSSRACYAGVAEVGLYVTASARGQGIGRALLEAIIESSERHGIWTLQSATIAENDASLAVQRRCGFRVIGRRERIARRDGVWRDTILLERRSATVGN
jgi:L-amino acid N-acyltransferase YncA